MALDWLALPGVRLGLRYQLIRHGDHPGSAADAPVIQGDINRPFVWSKESLYPDKKFLEDGLYDWNNAVTVSCAWDLTGLPVCLSASATVAHTRWDANESGESEPDARWRAIIGLGLELFRNR